MDAETFATLYHDYLQRKFPGGVPVSKGLEDQAQKLGCTLLSAEDDRAIAGAVYKELLGKKAARARWYIQVDTDGTVESALACKEILELKGYDCRLCADIGGGDSIRF